MHLIFDFDGTLIDSFDKIIEKFNILAEEFNFKRIYSAELAELRNLNSKELIQSLRIPIYKIPIMLHKARKLMSNEILTLSPFENLHQILKKIHNAKFSVRILTSNSEENVIAWLDIHQMKNLFEFIHIESNFFGKNRHLRKIIKKY